MSETPVDDLVTVNQIAERFEVPWNTVRRWADVDRKNGFPPVEERIGNTKFYDVKKVERWITLHRKMRRGGKK